MKGRSSFLPNSPQATTWKNRRAGIGKRNAIKYFLPVQNLFYDFFHRLIYPLRYYNKLYKMTYVKALNGLAKAVAKEVFR
jgi:hypothetical protein